MAYPSSSNCITGSTSTIARVRRSRRIWMNSFLMMAATREPMYVPQCASERGEGGVGRHTRLQLATRVVDPDLDAEYQVEAVALGLDVARRELGALVGGGHHPVEGAAGERIGGDGDVLSHPDPSEIALQDVRRHLQRAQVRDGDHGLAGPDDLADVHRDAGDHAGDRRPELVLLEHDRELLLGDGIGLAELEPDHRVGELDHHLTGLDWLPLAGHRHDPA